VALTNLDRQRAADLINIDAARVVLDRWQHWGDESIMCKWAAMLIGRLGTPQDRARLAKVRTNQVQNVGGE
jgi:hypothetical protein